MSVFDLVITRLAARQHGVVARWQLLALGVSRTAVDSRVRDGRLIRVHRGVYAVGVIDRRGYWMAAVLAGGEGALLSHRDAAMLWNLRETNRNAIDITVVGGSRPSRPRLTIHSAAAFHPDDRAEVDGIPVTSVSRTLLDLAEVVGPTELRRAYEAAERHESLDMHAIDALIQRSNGRRGLAGLLALLDYDPGPAVESKFELESKFLDLIRGAGLPLPSLNVLVEGHLVDAYWPAARLVVELQSYEHHGHRQAFEGDHGRFARLQVAGYEVRAFTFRQVACESEWVVEVVRAVLGPESALLGAARSAVPVPTL
jgi:hypothetical protein